MSSGYFINLAIAPLNFLTGMIESHRNKVFELRTYTTWMADDGIARTVVRSGAEILLPDALENSAAVNSFFNGRKYPLLVDTREIKSITKEARDHFSIQNRSSAVNSFAILIKSPLSRLIGNFFLGLNNPAVPVKLFTDENLAVEWLKQFNHVVANATEQERG